MSFKTFINKLWAGVAKVWKSLASESKKDVKLAVSLLNDIKAGKAYADLIAGLSPENAAKVQETLNVILVKAGYIQDYVDGMNEDDIIASIVNTINTKPELHKNIFLNNIALILTDVFADGKIGWDDLFLLPKYVFNNKENV
jgi:hypothetical protein